MINLKDTDGVEIKFELPSYEVCKNASAFSGVDVEAEESGTLEFIMKRPEHEDHVNTVMTTLNKFFAEDGPKFDSTEDTYTVFLETKRLNALTSLAVQMGVPVELIQADMMKKMMIAAMDKFKGLGTDNNGT